MELWSKFIQYMLGWAWLDEVDHGMKHIEYFTCTQQNYFHSIYINYTKEKFGKTAPILIHSHA